MFSFLTVRVSVDIPVVGFQFDSEAIVSPGFFCMLPKHSGTNRAARLGSRCNFVGFGYSLSSVTRRGPVPRAICGAAQSCRCYVQRFGWYLLFCQQTNETIMKTVHCGAQILGAQAVQCFDLWECSQLRDTSN